MDLDYKPTCAGGCGQTLSEGWFELWCPKCYSAIIEAYRTPKEFYESPQRKSKGKTIHRPTFLTNVCLTVTNFFGYFLTQ